MLENCEMLNNQAIELAAKGEFTEAIACFKQAISMEKQNHMLWFNLGITYRDSGAFPQAKDALEKAFYIKPTDEDITEALSAICLDMNLTDEAMAYIALGLSFNPANSHLWNAQGVLFFCHSNFAAAEEAFERALTINPYYYDALYNLKDTYEELGNKAGVNECSRRMKNLRGKK